MTTLFAAGDKLGRFVIVRPLGAGGMGTVYQARDPELGRDVAIKLLLDDRGDPTRLLREAQALAALSHPNVVTVHELGSHDGQVFLAMELVDGQSLDRYLVDEVDGAARGRRWRRVLDLYLQAGRGLAAVHARELVHRDVKPSNLLVDAGGRVRVSDLGLARVERTGLSTDPGPRLHARAARATELDATVDETASGAGAALGSATTAAARSSSTPDGLLASPLTAAGAVIGTPRYMAPEQHRGEPVTRAADQFAFCVALWEGVYDEHPFADGELATLRAAVLAGRRRPPPRGRGVPAWLERILARGLALAPGARWPSMTALVDRLERTPRRRRALALAAGGTLAIGAGLVTVALVTAAPAAAPCRGVTAPIDAVWSSARVASLQAAVVAADPAQGAARWQVIAAGVDRQAAAWRTMALDVCQANRVAHRESDTLHDRRAACLERRLTELRATVGALAASRSSAAIDRVAVGVTRLSPLAACADADALLALVPPPEDVANRAAVAVIDAEADAILAALAIGGDLGLVERAHALIARARAVGHPPALARALRVDAEVEFAVGAREGSVATLRELIEVAAAARDDALAAWAWPHLLQQLDHGQNQHEEAATLLPVARAAVTRAGGDKGDRVKLLAVSAMILRSGGHADQGRAALAAARELWLGDGARPTDPRVADTLGDLEHQAGMLEMAESNFEAAESPLRRAIELTTAAYGADHPETAISWHTYGESLRWQGKADDALAAYQTAARIREQRTGESTALAFTLVSLATTYQMLGKKEEALAALARAEGIFRAGGDGSRRDLATTLMTEGSVLRQLGRPAEARARLDDSIAAFGSLDVVDHNHGIAYVNRGELAANTGDCAAGVVDFHRAGELFTAEHGPAHRYNLFSLTGESACLLQLGRYDEALAAVDRALAIPSGAGQAGLVTQLRAFRARALRRR